MEAVLRIIATTTPVLSIPANGSNWIDRRGADLLYSMPVFTTIASGVPRKRG